VLYNKIEFPVPKAISDFWIADSAENIDLFANGNLVLYLQPGSYKSTYDRSSEAGIKNGFSSSIVMIAGVRYGFEITIEDNRMAVFRCLEALQELAETSLDGYYQPVICHDYVKPDAKDLATGFTVRSGALIVELTSGTMIDEDLNGNLSRTCWQFGCRASFKEI